VGLNVLLLQGAIPFTLKEGLSLDEDKKESEETFH